MLTLTIPTKTIYQPLQPEIPGLSLTLNLPPLRGKSSGGPWCWLPKEGRKKRERRETKCKFGEWARQIWQAAWKRGQKYPRWRWNKTTLINAEGKSWPELQTKAFVPCTPVYVWTTLWGLGKELIWTQLQSLGWWISSPVHALLRERRESWQRTALQKIPILRNSCWIWCGSRPSN